MSILDKQHTDQLLKSAKEKTVDAYSIAKSKTSELLDNLKQQEQDIKSKGYSEKAIETTKELITKLAGVPIVRVDRDDFLKKTFANSPYLDDILVYGPQYVFSIASLREKAEEIIANSTRKSTITSFAAGLPASFVTMAAGAAVDVVQFFGFALNMAQKVAYLFGENQLFTTFDPTEDMLKTDGSTIPESAQIKMISYLGVMLGVNGASALVLKTAHNAGATIGKKVAAQALTKTAWYPLFKKVASVLGYKITKQTVAGLISKSVPVLGGIVSGAITYATFKPMGGRLADVFVKMLNGGFDIEMNLNPDYEKKLSNNEDTSSAKNGEIIDAQFKDSSDQSR